MQSLFIVFALFQIVWLAFIVLMIVSMWKLFVKAGKPGWASLIPVYNYIVIIEMVGRPIWWIFLFIVPFVNIAVSIVLIYRLSLSFGKGGWFAAGLMFFPFIFVPIIAFGSAEYRPLAN